MDAESFKNSRSGKLLRTPQGYWSFIPNPLPPKLTWSEGLIFLLSEAERSLGSLEGIGQTLPNPHLLITPFIHKEAVLSSRIEGTQSSLSDLYCFEATGEERGDVLEVANYIRALEYGLNRLETLPLSLRLIREIHQILMEGVRGEYTTPGEFRKSQNWIGPPGCTLKDAAYVPPAPDSMNEALDKFEKFLHTSFRLPPLIEAALIHYQFEAIHPFLDGNGRIGRLLITLLLCQRGCLSKPLLYLSAFFESHRQEYYNHLLNVSQKGTWDKWIAFFLQGVVEQAKDAAKRSRLLLELHKGLREKIQRPRISVLVLRLLDLLFISPVITVNFVVERLSITFPAAAKAISVLEREGILRETTGKKRNRVYAADEIIKIME